MRYLIECPYCGNTYTVYAEHNKSFSCPSCGARNEAKNILQKEDDKAKLQRAVNEYLAQQRKAEEKAAEREKEIAFAEYRKRQEESLGTYGNTGSSLFSGNNSSAGAVVPCVLIVLMIIMFFLHSVKKQPKIHVPNTISIYLRILLLRLHIKKWTR